MSLTCRVLTASVLAVISTAVSVPAFGGFKLIENTPEAKSPPPPTRPAGFGSYNLIESQSTGNPAAQSSGASQEPAHYLPPPVPVSAPVDRTYEDRRPIAKPSVRNEQRSVDPVNERLSMEVERLQNESRRLQHELDRMRLDLARLQQEIMESRQRSQQFGEDRRAAVNHALDGIAQRAESIGSEIMRFGFGSSGARFEPSFDMAAKLIATAKAAKRINLYGHADNSGTAEGNERLAYSRALAVKQYMIDKGIQRDKVFTISRGSSEPIADNSTEDGRSRNRRVEAQFQF